MSIITNINGVDYEGFVGIKVSGNLENLCNLYRQECTAEMGGKAFPIKRGSSVKIFADGVNIFDGTTETSSGNTEGKISTGGRDSGLAILKCDLDPSANFSGPVGLVDVIKKTLKIHGINKKVIDDTGGLEPFTKRDKLNEDVGIKIWDFWINIARKKQALITLNRTGDVVIFRPGTKKYKCRIINRHNDAGGQNNIVSSSWDYNDSERVHKYVVHSQYNFAAKRGALANSENVPATGIFDTEATATKPESENVKQLRGNLALAASLYGVDSEIYKTTLAEIAAETGASSGPPAKRSRVATMGVAYDSAVPVGTVRHIRAKTPCDDAECERLAKWHCNLERAKSVSYSCVVPWLTADKDPWEYGYLIDVIDDDADIDATMLITGFEFGVSKSNDGSIDDSVTLTMTVPDAYSENAVVDSSLVHINRIGANWNDGDFK